MTFQPRSGLHSNKPLVAVLFTRGKTQAMPNPKILVVEGDSAELKILAQTLEAGGFAAEKAAGAAQAIDLMQRDGPAEFSAVLLDGGMPQGPLMQLLNWIKSVDSTLSVIVAAGNADAAFVHLSLKKGASDFLKKPIAEKPLLEAVGRACEHTVSTRQMATIQKNVRAVAQTNHFFKSILAPAIAPRLEIHYTPHDQVGGDFVNVLPIRRQNGGEKILMLVGDVSGHDLRAGFVSSYFQGLVRGLCCEGRGIVEICAAFNNILLEEWQRQSQRQTNPFKVEARMSLALLAVELDMENDRALVVNCGAPTLKIACVDGSVEVVESANMPLGWNNEEPLHSDAIDLKDVNYLFLASDGLHDWAEKLGMTSLGLAYRLLQDRKTPGGTPPDDLLTLRYQHAKGASSDDLWHPLSRSVVHDDPTPAAMAGRHFNYLKHVLPEAPGVEQLTRALEKIGGEIQRSCVAIRPGDGKLKLIAKMREGGKVEAAP